MPWRRWNKTILPRKLTWNLRIHPWKRKIIFQTIIFRFHVKFRGSTCLKTPRIFYCVSMKRSLVLHQDPEEGNTPLHLAAEEGTQTVKGKLIWGLNRHWDNNRGDFFLIWCAMVAGRWTDVSCVALWFSGQNAADQKQALKLCGWQGVVDIFVCLVAPCKCLSLHTSIELFSTVASDHVHIQGLQRN